MKIGIFWYWTDHVIGIAHSFNQQETDSIGLIDSVYAHVNYWDELQEQYPELKNLEYDQIPRGRIVFNTHLGKAIIYLDETLLYKSKIQKIRSFFELTPEKAVIKRDLHYRL